MKADDPPADLASAPAATADRRYMGELFWNQLWQSAGFLSKALFLFLLTPLMVAKWGLANYGLFGLASSLLVAMGLLDGGVRALTRVRLAEALRRGDQAGFRLALGAGVLTFSTVVTVAVLAGCALAASGWLSVWFKLPPGGSLVLAVTTALTGVFMITNLALEPLAAEGRLSLVKAANTWGAIAAIPLCGAALHFGGSVLQVVIINLACAVVPNFILLAMGRVYRHFPWRDRQLWSPRTLWQTLHSGFWYYLTTVSLIMKGHGFTFIVAAVASPAEAGLFYVVLRVTEILVNVGSTSSETSLASLALAENAEDRRCNFSRCWIYAALFCAHAAISLTFLGEPILLRWLKDFPQLPAGLGLAMAVSGLCGALSRIAVNASMGLGQVNVAARANVVEALLATVLGTVCLHFGGIPGLLLGSSIGTLAMLPVLRSIARLCAASSRTLYLQPLLPFLPGVALAAVVQGVAMALGRSWLHLSAAVLLSGAVAMWQLRSLHREA